MHTDTTPPSMTVPRSLKGFVTVVTLTPTEPKLSILTAFENVIRKSVARLTFCLSSGLTSWSTLCLESERSSAPAGPNANLPVRTGGPAHFAMYDLQNTKGWKKLCFFVTMLLQLSEFQKLELGLDLQDSVI